MNIVNTLNDVIDGCLVNIKNLLGENVIIHIPPPGKIGPDIILTLPTQPPIDLVGECKTNIVTRAQALNAVLQARAYAGPNARIVIHA
jgi:hypothetical protein